LHSAPSNKNILTGFEETALKLLTKKPVQLMANPPFANVIFASQCKNTDEVL